MQACVASEPDVLKPLLNRRVVELRRIYLNGTLLKRKIANKARWGPGKLFLFLLCAYCSCFISYDPLAALAAVSNYQRPLVLATETYPLRNSSEL